MTMLVSQATENPHNATKAVTIAAAIVVLLFRLSLIVVTPGF